MAHEEAVLECMRSSGLSPEDFGDVLYDACHRPLGTSEDVARRYEARARIRGWSRGAEVLAAEDALLG